MSRCCKVLCNGSYLIDYSTISFSGGELQVRLSDIRTFGKNFTIEANLWSANDIMELLLITDAIRRTHRPPNIDLVCPYFPYARQDRVCAPGEALSAKVMADLINQQHYSKVTIWDAHSDVVPALLDRVENVSCVGFVRRAVDSLERRPFLVAPDAGARKKVFECSRELWCGFVQAEKIRDAATGEISGTKIEDLPAGYDFLIVDDICDGGRTFIELAKAMRQHQGVTGKIYLYVTHGIFSKGLGVLCSDGLIDAVFCPNVKESLDINIDRSTYRVSAGS